MKRQRLIPRGTAESRASAERVLVALELTSRLNQLPFSDAAGRSALLTELFGAPLPSDATVFPPLYCDHGLRIEFGERVFVNQNCSFFDLGGITIGDRVMIGPGVTLITSGHPVAPEERYDGIIVAPIVVENDVWIGANVTVTPGVTIGAGAVIGAGTVLAKDVEPRTVVTGPGQMVRQRFAPQ